MGYNSTRGAPARLWEHEASHEWCVYLPTELEMRVARFILRVLDRAATAWFPLYVFLVVFWYGAYVVVGDACWILALANSFAVYLFVPLPIVVCFAVLMRRRVIWLATIVLTLLSMLLFGEALLPTVRVARAEVGEPALSVMTHNVLYTTGDATPIADIVLDINPDLIAFQELTSLVATQLETAIGARYPYRTPLRSDCRAQVAIWSVYPFVSEPADGGFACRMQTVLVHTYGGPIRVANVHAWPYTSLDREGVEESFLKREEQIRSLLDFIEGESEPFILVGDLNSTPQHEVYQILSARLTDAFREAGWGLGHTFPATSGRSWGIPYPSRLVRIDYILHSDHFRAEAAYVGRRTGASDHLPVIARLRLVQDG